MKNLPTRPHSEAFIAHYYQKYGDPYLPPFWMVAETLTLGSLSKLYQGLRDHTARNAIAGIYASKTVRREVLAPVKFGV